MFPYRMQVLENLDTQRLEKILIALVIVVIGAVIARYVARSARRLVQRRSSRQQAMLISRSIYYVLLLLVTFEALSIAGADFKVLLGAAGILTVAVGFAAQTSASNLISGAFLVAEQPFELGDTIQVGASAGEVISIDLLSVKIRTFDNLLLRIPNEALLKSEITNVTRFPIRRLDITLDLAHHQDPSDARRVLEAVAERNELCLAEPKPTLHALGFGDSGVRVQFSVWAATSRFGELKTRLLFDIKEAFDAEGIEFPFPRRIFGTAGPLPLEWTGEG
ncbi:MAG: mechanosensitive ion channel family protein [Holophagales bacterium]|nr:mechanosensitive ion channel family protein [Holophagales bacterium]